MKCLAHKRKFSFFSVNIGNASGLLHINIQSACELQFRQVIIANFSDFYFG
jgi:hypothetical protein